MQPEEYVNGKPLCTDCGVQEPARIGKGKRQRKLSVCIDCYETKQDGGKEDGDTNN